MKVWRSFMEEWEQTAKQFKSNAEFLESLCQDKLTHLYQDKRKARKNYHEEHQKIATQFTNVSFPSAKTLFIVIIINLLHVLPSKCHSSYGSWVFSWNFARNFQFIPLWMRFYLTGGACMRINRAINKHAASNVWQGEFIFINASDSAAKSFAELS